MGDEIVDDPRDAEQLIALTADDITLGLRAWETGRNAWALDPARAAKSVEDACDECGTVVWRSPDGRTAGLRVVCLSCGVGAEKASAIRKQWRVASNP